MCVWRVRSLVELELETLEESLPGDGVFVLEESLCPSPSTAASLSARTPAPSSQPFRLLKVILALRMWYRGISEEMGEKRDLILYLVIKSVHYIPSLFLSFHPQVFLFIHFPFSRPPFYLTTQHFNLPSFIPPSFHPSLSTRAHRF